MAQSRLGKNAILVPIGTTAERPSSPEAGEIRFNTDLDTFEGYDGFSWGSIGRGTESQNISFDDSAVLFTAADVQAAIEKASEAENTSYDSTVSGLATDNVQGAIDEVVDNLGVFGSGSAGSPSITFDGDTNTGLFRPAADTLAASTNGSERIRIDSSGNVGIGTSSPNAKLHIEDSHPITLTPRKGVYVFNESDFGGSWGSGSTLRARFVTSNPTNETGILLDVSVAGRRIGPGRVIMERKLFAFMERGRNSIEGESTNTLIQTNIISDDFTVVHTGSNGEFDLLIKNSTDAGNGAYSVSVEYSMGRSTLNLVSLSLL